MSSSRTTDAIAAGRVPHGHLARNFGDLHPPLTEHEAHVEPDRCYFRHAAPCQTACPPSIDIPPFTRQIQAGRPVAAAETILDANICGGVCARVCPTVSLYVEACVIEAAEGKPVK